MCLIRLQEEMAQLVGSLELFVILNYPIHLQLLLSPWVQEITFHLHLDGYVTYTNTMVNIMISYIYICSCLTVISSAYLQGKKNPGTDKFSAESFLAQVIKAKEIKIDKYIHDTLHIILVQLFNFFFFHFGLTCVCVLYLN